MALTSVNTTVPKPIAGFVFLLFWAVAIVAWCLANASPDQHARSFIVDIGLVFAFSGFASLFIDTRKGFVNNLILSLIGVALFALADFTGLLVMTYALRILAPAIAVVMVPTLRLVNGLRILS